MTKRTCDACQRKAQAERSRRHRVNNPGSKKISYERNKAAHLAYCATYAQENRETVRAAGRAWRKRNPGVANARRRNRKVIKLDAIDTAIRKWFYDKRQEGQVVDHIQPLAAGGEHAPWNMQILSWEVNASKGDEIPTLREVMRGERRYRLLRRIFQNASQVGTAP